MPETIKLTEDVVAPQDGEDLLAWLQANMNGDRKWLLLHADDGVIWGRWDNGALITSHDVAPDISPELRLVTLQQAFLFGAQDEVRVWRDEAGWLARRITDAHGAEFIEEKQVLWGDAIKLVDPRGFTHVWEKKQGGMDHVVPVIVGQDDLDNRGLKLIVHHFLVDDQQTGEARIALSRLVGLEPDRQLKAQPELQEDEQ